MTSLIADAAQWFDLAAYRREGVVVLRGVFDAAYVAELKRGWQKLEDQLKSGAIERMDRFVFGNLPAPIGDVWNHPALRAVANASLGTDVALYMNRILIKDSGWNGAVAMHQDHPYFNGNPHKLSVFVPLMPTQADGGNGGLKFVRGSHHYGALERGTIMTDEFEPMDELAPDLEVGDVVVMDFLTWHYSDEAVVPDERPLMQITYQPSSDGSFAGEKFGVPEPTLVSGEWHTRHFAELRRGIMQDRA